MQQRSLYHVADANNTLWVEKPTTWAALCGQPSQNCTGTKPYRCKRGEPQQSKSRVHPTKASPNQNCMTATDSHWVTERAPDTNESRKLFRPHVPRGEHSETPQRKNKACQKRNFKKHLSENITADGCITDDVQKDELEAEIRTKKAPWPNGVTNDMILHLGPSAKKASLALFNKSWKSGTVPALYEKATLIPIHKKGKDKKHPSSYRPISLLSCLGSYWNVS